MEMESAVAAGEFCVSKVDPARWSCLRAWVRRRVNVRLEMNVSCVPRVSGGLVVFGRRAVKEGGARESCEWAMGRGSGGAQLSKASGRGKREAGGIKWEQAGSSGIKWERRVAYLA